MNVVCAIALGNAKLSAAPLAATLFGMSSAYVGGMFLNDAFDRHIDAKERPERPIPSGLVSATHVFQVGALLLVSSVALTSWAALESGGAVWQAVLATLVLSGLIVLYNAWHKNNPLAPLIMGSCRGLVYCATALSNGGSLTLSLLMATGGLIAYTYGITVVARSEMRSTRLGATTLILFLTAYAMGLGLSANALELSALVALGLGLCWLSYCLRPLLLSPPRPAVWSVVRLIAGMALLDGFYAASTLGVWAPTSGLAALGATLFLQRVARGS
jgi:4-hydroxybenzoate polyprenyltransferase